MTDVAPPDNRLAQVALEGNSLTSTTIPSLTPNNELEQFQWSDQVEQPISYGKKEQAEILDPILDSSLKTQASVIKEQKNSVGLYSREIASALHEWKSVAGITGEYASVVVILSKYMGENDSYLDKNPFYLQVLKNTAFHLHKGESRKSWSHNIKPTETDVTPTLIESLKNNEHWERASNQDKQRAVDLTLAVAIGSGNLKTALQFLDSVSELGFSDEQIQNTFIRVHAAGFFDHALTTYPTLAEGVIASMGEVGLGVCIKDRPETAILKNRANNRILERKRVDVAEFDKKQVVADISYREQSISLEELKKLALENPKDVNQEAEVDNRVDRLVRGKAGNAVAQKLARLYRGDLPFEDEAYLQKTKEIALKGGKSTSSLFPKASGFNQFTTDGTSDMPDRLREQQPTPALHLDWQNLNILTRFTKNGGLFELMSQMIIREDTYFESLSDRSGKDPEKTAILKSHEDVVLFLSQLAGYPELENVIRGEFGLDDFTRNKTQEMREAIDRHCGTKTLERFEELKNSNTDLSKLAQLVESEIKRQKAKTLEDLKSVNQRIAEEREAETQKKILAQELEIAQKAKIIENSATSPPSPPTSEEPIEKKGFFRRFFGK